MSQSFTPRVTNQLLSALPVMERRRVMAACEMVELVFGTTLCERDEVLPFAYFPLRGFISWLAVVDKHPALEVGMVGNEGMLGCSLLLDVDTAPMNALVQGAGSALRLPRATLRSLLSGSPNLTRILHRYMHVVGMQLSQAIACMCFHEIEARLARWLLMTHDRAHADHFFLTHQFLADMLGVRRSAVTLAAGALQERGLIQYNRGDIEMISRHGLLDASCACYATQLADHARYVHC
ncbi:MAG: Crp/Fnr family transcriptional regulator [Xanthomonadales bacterium]|nr:Crp/Fnr family transcriptional regulator [Xanthomonadales bacterium]